MANFVLYIYFLPHRKQLTLSELFNNVVVLFVIYKLLILLLENVFLFLYI